LIFIYLSYGYEQGQVIERLVTEGLVQQQICTKMAVGGLRQFIFIYLIWCGATMVLQAMPFLHKLANR
jgi:hypothetical protein